MLLGSILLALAWAALQGEITLANLLVGYVVGYAILALLARGGVMPSTLVVANDRTRSAWPAFFAWELLLANFRVAADVLRRRTGSSRRSWRSRWTSPVTARSCCCRCSSTSRRAA